MINKYLFYFLILMCCLFSCQSKNEDTFDLIRFVNPNIGSVHARWFFYTPAAHPFGMAKPAPHTNAYNAVGSWLPGGYDDRYHSIEGFGQFHEFQIGGVVVMPTVGNIQTVPGTLKKPDEGYRSRFDKKDEYAKPGYYSVFLKDYKIEAELTSTKRVALYRFTFPKSDSANLIFDIGHKQGESSDIIETSMKMVNETELEGYVITYPEYAKFCDPNKYVKMYFYARLSIPPISYGTFVNKEITVGAKETKGRENGMFLRFSTKNHEIITMKIGLSYTSTTNAKLNLNLETDNLTFDEVKKETQNAWREKLGRIIVEGKDTTHYIKFYTGLYHALLGRGLSSDINGYYPKNDGSIGQIPLDSSGEPLYHHYNTDGIWGGFWNLGQLWALVYPDYLKAYLQSNLDFYKETGWLHDGIAAGVHTNGVQTNFFGLMLALAHHCNIPLFDDIEISYKAAYENETKYQGRPFGSGKYDLADFVNHGFIPSKDTTLSNGWVFNFGASHTLEYAFSSYAVAQFAKSLGKTKDYFRLMKQAEGWKFLFDPETQYIRPKYENGTFIENFNPLEAWRGFQEGNAAQYTWYVPHDPAGLIQTLGKKEFNERLETTFSKSQISIFGGGKELDSFSGTEKLYNHGNQPCLFQPWLFNYSGKPWLTQKWTRSICNEFYGIESLHGYGFGQDEDQGQLGAWFVMTAMGLFDVQGHSSARPSFQLGSPLFDKITVRLRSGKKLVIKTKNNSAANKYIQQVIFNGKHIKNAWIYRDDLVRGGTLILKMGKIPNKNWGIDMPPPSMSTEVSHQGK